MNKKDKERYARMQLKNGWDLPKGEERPLTGRKQRERRAYELLLAKPDEELMKTEREALAQQEAYRLRYQSVGFRPQEGALTGTPLPYREKAQSNLPAGEISGNSVAELETISTQELKKKRRRRLIIALSALFVIALAVTGRICFGPAILLADISSYKDVEIEIEGLEDENFTITVGEIAKMKKESIKVEVHNGELTAEEEPETGEAIGPTLDTFLDHYGKTVDDFKTMRVYMGNDSSKAYVRSMKESTLILSVANGRKALGAKQTPLRIASEDMEASEWAGWVRKIVFTQ